MCCVVAVATAAVVSGCRDGERAAGAREGKPSANAVEVPDLIGMRYRPTQEVLAKLGLRWGAMGTPYIQSKPLPDNVRSTGDDDFITDQTPSAGTKVEPGAVVRLRMSCTTGKLPPGEVCID